MNVRIHEIYPLEEVARAHNVSRRQPKLYLIVYLVANARLQDLEGRKTTGKLLLRP